MTSTTRARKTRLLGSLACGLLCVLGASFLDTDHAPAPQAEAQPSSGRPPIYVAFLWHMHQPIYYPYESVTQTQQRGAYSYDLHRIHSDRSGPYTTWPVDAVQSMMFANLPHGGAQVSFSGSLMENLDDFERAGWGFHGWKNRWRESNHWKTSKGNPRLDLVGFAYHHPLLPLLDDEVSRRQIGKHKAAYAGAWNAPGVPHRPYSKGFFPPENAFAPWMIPALKAEGVEWVMADNIHLQRACESYPYSPGGNLIPPNKADQLNRDPGDWVQLRDLWAPTKVSAAWSFRPHWVKHVDPKTGVESKLVVVPTARYMGNEDGRGGFGALQYEKVLSQIEAHNTDPNHPVLVVLHHDGDNYGGGSDSYYHANFQRFVRWAQAQGHRFVPTTIQDYLDMFPPARNDVVHIEPGSWSGADNGDPEFKKWLGDPNAQTGYSPDVNSWAVMMAAANRVKTAGSLDPTGNLQGQAWRMLLNGFASDYWYWDGTEIWDSNPTRAANGATWHADQILHRGVTREGVGPQVFLPQREPYNPGAKEWGNRFQPTTFKVWTLAYDVSGLKRVTLRWRVDVDGRNATGTNHNETFRGGSDVGPWRSSNMTVEQLPASQTNPPPSHRAVRYAAQIAGQAGRLIDYYVEAEDNRGNTTRSPILHVYVGTAGAPAPPPISASAVRFAPASPRWTDTLTITSPNNGAVRWGVNGWKLPPTAITPAGSRSAGGVLETDLTRTSNGTYAATLGPFTCALDVTHVDFVIHNRDGSWDNNGGQNFKVPLQPKRVWWSKLRLDGGPLLVYTRAAGQVRFGPNGWQSVADARSVGPDANGVHTARLGPFPSTVRVVDFAVQYATGRWDNNGRRNFHVQR